ncbi:MAG: protein translocase subunit SecF [Proteobacteria bacterium]|nr:protein translocase subunit SecF [Pseudomonadota bacterium]MCL2308331.1 protein translocase subunit SecF [Pseudomonadota bacterium]
MEFFRFTRDIPFMRHALTFNIISLATFLLAVFFLAYKGLNFGVDFRGGTVMEISYGQGQAADLSRVRAAIDTLQLGEYTVQSFGTADTALIRMPLKEGASSAQLSERVMEALRADNSNVVQKRVDFVGPQVGKELYQNGALALLFVVVGVIIYLSARFEWRFAIAAIIANLHDIVIILGFFAFFQWEFSLPVLAAVLAVLGYSVNESVVIADRIRENFRKMRHASVPHVIDSAITATISRTVITHLSTQLMVVSMLVFGGEALHYFAMALTIGILFGMYSAALVMATIAMWLGVSRENLVKPERKKDGLEAEKIMP